MEASSSHMAILTAMVVILEPIGVLKLTPLVRFWEEFSHELHLKKRPIATNYDHVLQIFSENDQYGVGRWSLDPPPYLTPRDNMFI